MATKNRGRTHKNRCGRETSMPAVMLLAGIAMVIWSMAIAAGLTTAV